MNTLLTALYLNIGSLDRVSTSTLKAGVKLVPQYWMLGWICSTSIFEASRQYLNIKSVDGCSILCDGGIQARSVPS